MDNHDARKRLDQLARFLASAAVMIHVALIALDGIRLTGHIGDEAMPEKIAEDFQLVRSHVLDSVEAPEELLAIVRSLLLDWTVLNDLIAISKGVPLTERRLGTMEDFAERLGAELLALSQFGLLPEPPEED